MSKISFVLKIFLKDSPKTDNKYNKLILEFLNNNIDELISYGCYIRLILLNNTNIDNFLKMNIKNIPALYDDDTKKSITGVEDIIKYVIYKCTSQLDSDTITGGNENNNKCEEMQSSRKKKNTNDDEDPSSLRGYMMKEVLQDDEIEDSVNMDEVLKRSELYKKHSEVIKNSSGTNKNNLLTAKNNLNNKTYNTSIEVKTDKLEDMRNANNELTKTKKISSLINNEDAAFKSYWDNQEETEL